MNRLFNRKRSHTPSLPSFLPLPCPAPCLRATRLHGQELVVRGLPGRNIFSDDVLPRKTSRRARQDNGCADRVGYRVHDTVARRLFRVWRSVDLTEWPIHLISRIPRHAPSGREANRNPNAQSKLVASLQRSALSVQRLHMTKSDPSLPKARW